MRHALRCADDGEHGVQQSGGGGGGQPGDVRQCEQRNGGEQRRGKQQCERRDDEDVDQHSRCGDAMEICGHGERHDQLDDGGDEAEIEEQEAPADGECEDILRAAGASITAAEEWLEVLPEETQRDAELGEARLECGVHADGIDGSRSGEEGRGGALHHRNGDARDGDDGKQSHLEPASKSACGSKTSRQSAAKPRLLSRLRSR